jgi:queuine tRNA-ribosyltransferase
MSPVFSLQARCGHARAGVLQTKHGAVETPVFMPVGTQATVKSLASGDLETLNAPIILANTYHLAMRPGAALVRSLGGLHSFMSWPRAILTDSGGYQVFSHGARANQRALPGGSQGGRSKEPSQGSFSGRRKIDDDGVTFQSHVDGSRQRLTPESAMAIQADLGSDIAMAFDECPPSDAPVAELRRAMRRTTAWAKRCVETQPAPGQLRFGIVQGAIDLDLRREHLAEIAPLPFDGMALGGLSVGEPPATMHAVVREIGPRMPEDRPRYLMGVGTPTDLLVAIAAGIDMFDCVMPTRAARNGRLFVRGGHINIANAVHGKDPAPVEEGCGCEACRRYSRAYLAHLFRVKEILYYRLATLHNLHHYLTLVRGARQAIMQERLPAYLAEHGVAG